MDFIWDSDWTARGKINKFNFRKRFNFRKLKLR